LSTCQHCVGDFDLPRALQQLSVTSDNPCRCHCLARCRRKRLLT
jgi:hypothetical protein